MAITFRLFSTRQGIGKGAVVAAAPDQNVAAGRDAGDAMRIIVCIAIAMLGFDCAPVAAADSCEGQIPASLRKVLESSYPDFRIPRETDNLQDDVSGNREQGGSGCLGYASADFNGDGMPDVIIGLSAKAGGAAIVVVAMATGASWEVHELKRWKGNRSRLYVATGKPDRYDRSKSLDGPLEKGEADSLVCPNSVAILGATEASGVAYCFNANKWRFVWMSD
jgi:hypothetical protein